MRRTDNEIWGLDWENGRTVLTIFASLLATRTQRGLEFPGRQRCPPQPNLDLPLADRVRAGTFAQCDLVIHLDTLPIIDRIRQQRSKFVADSDVVPADSEGVVFAAAELTLSTDAKAQCPLDWIRIAIGDSGVSEQSPAP